jgi:Icc protein
LPTLSSAGSDSVLLVQLTDSHLFAAADGRLLGLETRDSLQRVIDRVRLEQAGIDLLLATGDLSQDGSSESYRHFLQLTDGLAADSRWLAGNHDEMAVMREFCAGSKLLDPVVDLGDWRIIILDSSISGAVPGHLEQAQLALLEQALDSAGPRHVLIALHHHPLDVDCAWLQPIGLRNPQDLFAITGRYPQVRVMLWGHIHQEFDQLRNGVRMLASPSTCVQFVPGSAEFLVDHEAPGYRWLRLFSDGRLETGVSRVSGIDFEIDYSVRGY